MKRKLFNWTKQDKTGQNRTNLHIFKEVLFYKLHTTEKQETNNEFNLSCVTWMWEAGGRERTDCLVPFSAFLSQSRALFLPPVSHILCVVCRLRVMGRGCMGCWHLVVHRLCVMLGLSVVCWLCVMLGLYMVCRLCVMCWLWVMYRLCVIADCVWC